MSEAFTPPPPEPIRIASGRAFLVAAITLSIFAIASFGGWCLIQAHGPAAPMPETLGQPEVGMVGQVPFSVDQEAARLRAGQRRRLSSYGWVDREAGLIHQPIEQAMEQLLREQEGASQ